MSAPPFPSFPSFNSFPVLDPGPSQQASTSEDTHKTKHKSRKHDEHRSRRDGKDKHRHEDRSRKDKRERRKEEKSRALQEASSVPPLSESDSATRFFYSDRKGDQLNVKYGGLHAGDIPRYRLVGGGRKILGLNNAFTVVQRDRHGLEVALGKKRKVPALTDSKTRHLLAAAPTRRLVTSEGYKYQEEDGFLRLYSAKASTRDVATYREPQLARPVDSEDSDSGSDDDDETSDEESDGISLGSRQTTLKDLEQRLSSDPTDIPTWLNLLSNTLSGVPLYSKNASKARAEISLSILSRAIAAHPSNQQSSTLRLKLLSAGEELWEETKLAEEWEGALRVGGTEMWIMWLDWRLRSSRRGIDGLVEDVQRIYSALPKDGTLDKFRVFQRAAIALRDAGYVERAHALFQAQAELMFKRPRDLVSSSFETTLDRLEAFWESEVARVGEPEAKGWAAWEAAGCPDADAGPSRSPPTRSVSRDPYSRWAMDELVFDTAMVLPCRSFDEEASNDPYATILFSDIRPFLVDLVSDDAKRMFRIMWLSFLGLHIPGSLNTTDDRWSSTHLASRLLLATMFPQESDVKLITADAHSGVLIGKERTLDHPFGPIKNWGAGLVDATEGTIAGRYRLWSRADVADVPITLVRVVFQRCKQTEPDADWDAFLVAFEAALSPKQATKICKQLLSSAQDSVLHWKAYAQLERMRGKPNDARKVYDTVLSTSGDKPGVAQLWWDWAELEWLSGTSESTLQVILRSAGTAGSGTVALLRGRRALDDAIRGAFTLWKDREAYIKLKALLELLTTGTTSALSVFDQACNLLPVGSVEHESLTVAALNMLYVRSIILSNAFKPGILRERAERAIQMYPDNTLILGFFLAAEKGEGIWGRVRAMLAEDDAAKDLTRIMADVWAASWERGSWRLEEERIRTKLSNAALSERTRYSVILWRIYLHFEIRCGRLKQAKTLLFRAVKECPLAKDLYLLAFGPLRTVFTPRELNDWAETMGERGIRVRQGLDELLEGWTETMGSRTKLDGESDGEDDEIEYNASELRRLRPY